MKLFLFCKAILPAVFVLAISVAKAQWSTRANIDNKLNARVYDPLTFCTDGKGGAIFTWSQTFDGAHHYVRANRIDSLGFLRWGDSGRVINIDSAGLVVTGAPNICEDGKGGCYIVYSRNALPGHPLVCHRLDSNGHNLWVDSGLLITNKFPQQYYQTYPELINDANQGVIIAFFTSNLGTDTSGLYAQRLNLAGQRQWGVHGKRIEAAADIRTPKIASDGKRGIVLVWTNYSFDGLGHQYQLRMNRIKQNGQLGFTTGTQKLNTLTPVGYGPLLKISLTSSKNYIVTWTKDGINTPVIYTQKVDSTGNFKWGAAEKKVRDTTGEVRSIDMISDGSDGTYYSWTDGRKVNVAYGVFIQHLNNSGAKQWVSQGIRIDSNTTGGYSYMVKTPGNHTNIFWRSSPDGRVHMQQFDAGGALQLPGNGSAIAASGNDLLYYKSIQAAGNGHDIVFLKQGGSGDCYAKYVPFSIILPLTLTSFTAQNMGKVNLLTWETQNETNTGYFVVERSNNGTLFNERGSVTAANNNNENDYRYEDAGIGSGDVFYRLKYVDADGRYTYSKVVNINGGAIQSLMIAPNPVSNNCIIYFTKASNTNTAVALFDYNGKLLKQLTLPAGQTQLSLDVSKLAAGYYFIRTLAGKDVTAKMFTVVK